MPLTNFKAVLSNKDKNKIEAFKLGIYIFDNDVKATVIKEAELISSNGKGQQGPYSLKLRDLGTDFKNEFDNHPAMTDDAKQLVVAGFLYEIWQGELDLCKFCDPRHKDPYTCTCVTNIDQLKNAIKWDDVDPGLFMEKLFVWILLNKKEWKRPKNYLVSWIRFLIVKPCLSIERLLANKIMSPNVFDQLKKNMTSTVERYASPTCDILIGGLSTELEPSYDRLGIEPKKQIDLRKNQNLEVWLKTVDQKPLLNFLQKTILGEGTRLPQLNGLVYGLLMDIWRGEEEDPNTGRCENWQKWVEAIELWRLIPSTSKPQEPNVKPIYKGNVLCCSSPTPYFTTQNGNETASDNKNLNFHPPLIWPTQHCPSCNAVQSGGDLRHCIWLQGERFQTITKTCEKKVKTNKVCSICNIQKCSCKKCLPKKPKKCKQCKICTKCDCTDCNCTEGAKCDCIKCKKIFFSSKKNAISHIYMLTNTVTKISCFLDPLSHHITGGAGAGTGKTSEVFIDVTSSFKSNSSNTVDKYFDNIIKGKNTINNLKTILLDKCCFNWDEIEPKLKELVIYRCNALGLKAEKMSTAYKDGKSKAHLHHTPPVADIAWAINLEKQYSILENAIDSCLNSKGVGCTIDDLIEHFKSLNIITESVPSWVEKIFIESY